MHVVHVTWCTGWTCTGKGSYDERDATVERRSFCERGSMEEGRPRGRDEAVGGGLGGKGTAMGMLGFSVAEAGSREKEPWM